LRGGSGSRLRAVLAAGVVAMLSACSLGGQSQPTDWSQQSSASGGGGLQQLIAAARREGALYVPGPSDDWPGYAALVNGFKTRYGISVVSLGTSGDADELRHSSLDVFDLAVDTADSHIAQLAPYLVFYWLEIPGALKHPKAYWYSSCGGFMTLDLNAAVDAPPIQSLADITSRGYTLGLHGRPIQSNEALYAVMTAALGSGGTPDDVGPGLGFFDGVAVTEAGPGTVNFEWNYIHPGHPQFTPPATVFAYDVQAVNRTAPHPAAARLWEEYLFSDAGQNVCVTDGARPARLDAMRADGVLDVQAAAALEPVPSGAVTLSAQQLAAARAYVGAHWVA
jgi:putative spermidine/putrescine transport system substrate-binding protein